MSSASLGRMLLTRRRMPWTSAVPRLPRLRNCLPSQCTAQHQDAGITRNPTRLRPSRLGSLALTQARTLAWAILHRQSPMMVMALIFQGRIAADRRRPLFDIIPLVVCCSSKLEPRDVGVLLILLSVPTQATRLCAMQLERNCSVSKAVLNTSISAVSSCNCLSVFVQYNSLFTTSKPMLLMYNFIEKCDFVKLKPIPLGLRLTIDRRCGPVTVVSRGSLQTLT